MMLPWEYGYGDDSANSFYLTNKIDVINEIKKNTNNIDAIGFQYHVPIYVNSEYVSAYHHTPQWYYNQINYTLNQTGVKEAVITEYDNCTSIGDYETEEAKKDKANYLRDTLISAYSNKNISEFSFWVYNRNSSFIKEEWEAYEELMKEWQNDKQKLNINESKSYQTRVYRGKYLATIKINDNIITKDFEVSEDNNEIVMTVDSNISNILINKEPNKKEYIQNEELNLDGGEITIVYDDGTSINIPMNSEGVETSGFDSTTLGDKTIIIQYGGHKVQFTVTVNREDKTIPTITYDIDKITNKDVTATITFNNPDTIILNNDGKNSYTFSSNGEFTFEYIDVWGNNKEEKAIVTWIDKNPPIISNIVEGTVYEHNIIPIIEDKESNVRATLLKETEEIRYEIGQEISENGNYTLTAIDEAGNTTIVSFVIKKVEEKDDTITSDIYSIEGNIIKRVIPETCVKEFKDNIYCESEYVIKDLTGNEMSDDSYLGTRCKVVVETGREYIVVVLSDLDGNGRIDLTDIGIAPKLYLNIMETDEIGKLVYDLDGNGIIDLIDIGRLPKVYLGLLNILTKLE